MRNIYDQRSRCTILPKRTIEPIFDFSFRSMLRVGPSSFVNVLYAALVSDCLLVGYRLLAAANVND